LNINRRNALTLAVGGIGICVLPSCHSTPSAPAANTRGFSLGIDQLAGVDFAPLKGRRVGFITNQTSVNASGVLSRVALQRGIGSDLKALFGPEHGLDTRTRAGDHVANSVDTATGLPVLSLYGPTRKPNPQMLAGLDVLVFDIQDIGVRSYTYISTMALAMEACGEAGKDFVVLDRPNPLGGALVQGPPMEEESRSFVGQVPVPYRHGLTIGELAKMIIAKNWMKANPNLKVISMQGWRRDMAWLETGLTWVPTSPNIPYWQSPIYCAATGILGELRNVDIGIGTAKPFQYAAATGIDGPAFSAFINAQNLSGISAKPYVSAVKPGFNGIELDISPDTQTDIMALGIMLIQEVVRRSNGSALASSSVGQMDLFKKVYGSNALAASLQTGTNWQDLVASWIPSIQAFKQERLPFLLY
jgi:uncharacterized protein YbbC (DUF1343 family)